MVLHYYFFRFFRDLFFALLALRFRLAFRSLRTFLALRRVFRNFRFRLAFFPIRDEARFFFPGCSLTSVSFSSPIMQ